MSSTLCTVQALLELSDHVIAVHIWNGLFTCDVFIPSVLDSRGDDKAQEGEELVILMECSS